ncbi:MAG TPA: site-2 protease family protein [Coleofasciculaceae cyanobacterium]|jgi:Zn-dependent protease
MFVEKIFTDPAYFFSASVIVVGSITIHELFHALAASSQGDDTAAKSGYLTLNPLVHMGSASLMMLLLFGFAWGQTPINPARFRHRFSAALVSFAGPLANLLLVILAVWVVGIPGLSAGMKAFLGLAAILNAFLFLFNMLPVPPLDGFGVLETFLPALRRQSSGLSRYGFLILLVLFFFFGLGDMLYDAAWRLVREVGRIRAAL